ncbi:MAG TPA: YdeI/OmpD-associated family protein [Micromonosporaceae bacterium]
MARAAFRTTVLAAGKTATGIEIPPEAVEALGSGKRPPVVVTINGYSYRNTVAVMGGVFMLGISAEHRKGSGVSVGDEIDVELVLDEAPREVELPADFAAALAADERAAAAYAALSPSRKKAQVTSIEGAKTAETRERRIAKAVADLRM